jgi:hypothetical protein
MALVSISEGGFVICDLIRSDPELQPQASPPHHSTHLSVDYGKVELIKSFHDELKSSCSLLGQKRQSSSNPPNLRCLPYGHLQGPIL